MLEWGSMMRQRKDHGFEWQERDGRILEAIFTHEGVLTVSHIWNLFFPDATTDRAVTKRMMLLEQQGYVCRLGQRDRARFAETLYFLTEAGLFAVAGRVGATVDSLKSGYRSPKKRESLLPHDIGLNSVRIAIERAIQNSGFFLHQWTSSSEFWRQYDTIPVTFERDGKQVTQQRQIRPDGYLELSRTGNDPNRFLLEYDNSTEDQERIARDKINALTTYIRSAAYRKRFGKNAGRVLIVFQSERRMKNTQAIALRELDRLASMFYFTIANSISYQTVLTKPIWFNGAGTDLLALYGD